MQTFQLNHAILCQIIGETIDAVQYLDEKGVETAVGNTHLLVIPALIDGNGQVIESNIKKLIDYVYNH
jgi:hypothetical protein